MPPRRTGASAHRCRAVADRASTANIRRRLRAVRGCRRRTGAPPAGSAPGGRRQARRPAAACRCGAPRSEGRLHRGHTPSSARARARINSRPPATSAASAITPARCGRNTSRLIPYWPDKHPLTCDNDRADSWEDDWIRQPPAYQEVASAHATRRPVDKQTASLHKPTLVTEGSLLSRNTGQIQIQFSDAVDR